jgi:transcriptional regulator with XRE-family HTH domain
VGSELRRRREASGLTTAEVCRRLDFSPSKLSRIETGKRPVLATDLEAMAELYQISPSDRQRLLRRADESRGTDKAGDDYSQLELAASRIDDYKTSVVTGLLQTPAYTRALFRGFDPYLPEQAIEERVARRSARQAAVWNKTEPPELNFILDEAALRREVGGPVVMQQQLFELTEIANRPHTSIQVIPFTAGAHLGMDSLFTILQFREAVKDQVYIDAFELFLNIDDARLIRRYREGFDRLSRIALTPEASRELIQSILAASG